MLRQYLKKLVDRVDLSTDEAAEAMRLLISGKADSAQVAGLLIAWRMKGETGGEILGCARILREHAKPFGPVPEDAVDTCGTGGDGAGTFNISTVAAFVAAAAGAPIAKHGNQAVSSSCGSADLLEALGVRTEVGPEAALRCLKETGYTFLFAPAFHLAMQNVADTRRALGTRTLFNLLGPLINPARVKRQVMGVFHSRYQEPLAEALAGLGAVHAMVVQSRDGLDEISVCAETDVVEIGPAGERLRKYILKPEDFGIRRRDPGALRGGKVSRNLEIAREIFDGQPGAHRDAVVLNAAAALYVAGAVRSLQEGVGRAGDTIDSGAARKKVEEVREQIGTEPKPGRPAGKKS